MSRTFKQKCSKYVTSKRIRKSKQLRKSKRIRKSKRLSGGDNAKTVTEGDTANTDNAKTDTATTDNAKTDTATTDNAKNSGENSDEDKGEIKKKRNLALEKKWLHNLIKTLILYQVCF